MKKSEFVAAIADKLADSGVKEVTKKAVEAHLDATLEVIIESVAKGDEITLVGFGSFKRVERKGRTARVPGTGKTVKVPAKKAPAFKAGKIFKDKVEGKKAEKKKK